MTAQQLALDFALTIRHDGHGGVADDLADRAGLTAWVREHRVALGMPPFSADDATLAEARELRAAVRSLFAYAVRPAPPSPADAPLLIPVAEAVRRLNAGAARLPTVARLQWPEGGAPAAAYVPADHGPEPRDQLAATLAGCAIGFLTGPDRVRLRACQGPRCVRYFIKEHPRQEWCKPSCGNRARVARHHQRRAAPGPA